MVKNINFLAEIKKKKKLKLKYDHLSHILIYDRVRLGQQMFDATNNRRVLTNMWRVNKLVLRETRLTINTKRLASFLHSALMINSG